MNIFELWDKILEQLERQLEPKWVDTWLRPLQIVSFNDGLLELMADGTMFRNRVIAMVPNMESAFLQVSGKACAIRIRVKGDGALPMKHSRSTVIPFRGNGLPLSSATCSSSQHNQSFDNFVVGDGNRLAHLVTTQLSAGERDELVYVYGGVGTGKTHLLLAAQAAMKKRGKSVLYLRGDEFSRRVKESERSRLFDELRRQIIQVDAFLLDGLQAVERRAHKFLWSILEARLRDTRPMVLTGDREPSAFAFPHGFVSMLGEGHELKLDAALRHSIFSLKVAAIGLSIEHSVLEQLVPHLHGSVREIEGLVDRLRREPKAIGLTLVEGTVKMVAAPGLRRASGSLDDIIETVAYVYGLTKDELKSRGKSRKLAHPRHIAAYCCRKFGRDKDNDKKNEVSYPAIGLALGGRDHTTIMRSCTTVVEWIESDAPQASKLKEIEILLIGKSPERKKEKVA